MWLSGHRKAAWATGCVPSRQNINPHHPLQTKSINAGHPQHSPTEFRADRTSVFADWSESLPCGCQLCTVIPLRQGNFSVFCERAPWAALAPGKPCAISVNVIWRLKKTKNERPCNCFCFIVMQTIAKRIRGSIHQSVLLDMNVGLLHFPTPASVPHILGPQYLAWLAGFSSPTLREVSVAFLGASRVCSARRKLHRASDANSQASHPQRWAGCNP